MSGTHPLRLVTVLGTAVATLAVSATVAPGSAAGRAASPAASPDRAAAATIASGLDNPRQLTFRKGRLYVAEAGHGGSGPCFKGGEGTDVCYGASGAVSKLVRGGGHRRVATGFPSLAGKDGSAAIGPSDLVLRRHGRYVLSIGLGNPPAVRSTLPSVGQQFLGTLTAGRFGHGRHVLSDLAAYEASADPNHDGADSDPVGFIRRGHGFAAVDAGGNDVLQVNRHGLATAVRTFAARSVPSPFGGTMNMEAVPTSVVRGPHHALFVSQLTGFPFPAGAARIFRLVPGRATQVYATGLTNVTDLAWHRGHLYAVQISDEGLFADKHEPPSGSLVRVVPGGAPVTVADNLPAPYGIAVRRGKAYVTTCSVCPSGGGVRRIPLG
jgi:hypothetical protein